MADAASKPGAQTLSKAEIVKLIGQFIDAKQVNTKIDDMFKPLIARIKQDTGKKDFTLFALFFDEAERTELKKYVKDNITKLTADIKAEKLLSVEPAPTIMPKPVEALKAANKEVYGSVKSAPTSTPPVVAPVQPAKQVVQQPAVTPAKQVVQQPVPNRDATLEGHFENLATKMAAQQAAWQAAHEKAQSKTDSALSNISSKVASVLLARERKEEEAKEEKKDKEREPVVKTQSTEDVLKSQNAVAVNLVGIDDEALKKLGMLFKPQETKPAPTPMQQVTGTTGFLEKALGAAMAAFTAAKLLEHAWDETGPLRGAIKMFGSVLLKTASLLLRGMIAGIKAAVAMLPESIREKILAKMASFKGIGTTIGSAIGKVAAKIGSVISSMGSMLMKGLERISPVIAGAVKSIGGTLGKMASGFGKFLFGRLKVLPYIGPFIGLAFGVKRFSEGDYAGGLFEIFGNLLAIAATPIPGLGFIISIMTDLLLTGYDIKTGGIKESKNASWNKWFADFGNTILNSGPIRWLRNIGESLGDILNGDWKQGFTGLVNALSVLGIAAIPGCGFLLSLLEADPAKDTKNFVIEKVDVIGKLKNDIADKLASVFKSIMAHATAQIDAFKKMFGFDDTNPLPTLPQTGMEKSMELRTKIFKIKEEEKLVQSSQHMSESIKTRRMNELTTERTNLQSQLDIVNETNAAKKAAAKKASEAPASAATQTPSTTTATGVDSETPDDDYNEEPAQVSLNPMSESVEDLRKLETEKATQKQGTAEIVGAIHELKDTQVAIAKTQAGQKDSVSSKKESTISVVTNTSNNAKLSSEVNVDTARDSVFIARSGLRDYLYGQRVLI